jgi:hypothetical protein
MAAEVESQVADLLHSCAIHFQFSRTLFYFPYARVPFFAIFLCSPNFLLYDSLSVSEDSHFFSFTHVSFGTSRDFAL